MIPRKLCELFFSQLWLLIIPILVIPIVMLVMFRDDPTYESRATIWVDRTLSGAATTLGQANPWLTPAQNQAQTINDLLATRSFRAQVASTAGLIPEEPSPEMNLPEFEVWASTIGSNLVTITATSPHGPTAAQLVAAVIEEYETRAVVEAERQAIDRAGYYQQQLPLAEAELAKRETALHEFLAQNPDAAVPGSSASLGLEYRTLLNNVESQQAVVSGIYSSLQATHLTLATIEQNQLSAFQVQDPPLVPRAPMPLSRTQQLGIPLVGAMFGVLISTAYLVIRFRTDHTIRSVEDLADSNIPVLGAISYLRPNGFWWHLDPDRILAPQKVRRFARRVAASIPMTDET